MPPLYHYPFNATLIGVKVQSYSENVWVKVPIQCTAGGL